MEGSMSATVQVQLPDDLKSAIDRQVAKGHAVSDADFLRQAARLYAEELDADEDLWTIAQAGIADAEAGRYILIETEADAEALYERTMAQVRAGLAADKA
jgi:Arc/MetJ-type ribon-helix-helix transcriptional regulator